MDRRGRFWCLLQVAKFAACSRVCFPRRRYWSGRPRPGRRAAGSSHEYGRTSDSWGRRRRNAGHGHQGRVPGDRRADRVARRQRDFLGAAGESDFQDRQRRQRVGVSGKFERVQRPGVRLEGPAHLDADRGRPGAYRRGLSQGRRSRRLPTTSGGRTISS